MFEPWRRPEGLPFLPVAPQCVIAAALFRITQDLVGFIELLEPLFCIRINMPCGPWGRRAMSSK
jgi:hypothetical protein